MTSCDTYLACLCWKLLALKRLTQFVAAHQTILYNFHPNREYALFHKINGKIDFMKEFFLQTVSKFNFYNEYSYSAHWSIMHSEGMKTGVIQLQGVQQWWQTSLKNCNEWLCSARISNKVQFSKSSKGFQLRRNTWCKNIRNIAKHLFKETKTSIFS